MIQFDSAFAGAYFLKMSNLSDKEIEEATNIMLELEKLKKKSIDLKAEMYSHKHINDSSPEAIENTRKELVEVTLQIKQQQESFDSFIQTQILRTTNEGTTTPELPDSKSDPKSVSKSLQI